MNTTKRNASIVVVVLCLVAAMALLSRTGSRSALDRYKAGLRAKGEKLTLAEIAIPPSTNAEEIASRQILATISFPQTGIQLSSLMEFIANGKARVAWRGKLHWDPAYFNKTNGIMPGDWAAYDRTNAPFAPCLEKLKPALEHPAPDTGWVYQDTYQSLTNGPPRTFVRDRIMAQALVCEGIGELHRGNLDAAITDLHALAGMVRMNRNELTLVHSMIRIAIAGLALNATWEALQAPGWDEQRLESLQHDWEQVNLIDAVERGFIGERACGAVLMTQVRQARGQEFWNIFSFSKTSIGRTGTNNNIWIAFWMNDVLAPAYKMTSMNEDELIIFKHDTEVIGIVRLTKANKPWPEVNTACSNLFQQVEKKLNGDHIGRFHINRFIASAISIPNAEHALRHVVQTETKRRLAVTAIALKRYELRHGKSPPNLLALTPEFLAQVPIDPMSGRPLCYRLNPDGTFVLYSTGEDGKDDGGKGGMDFWTGLDAVWPSAATTEEADAVDNAVLKK
jgi:hypothetical protein